MKINEALKWGSESLVLMSDSARLDAELILSYVLKKPTTFLFTHDEAEIGFWQVWKYKRLIEKRKKGMPVAYITGYKEFYGLDFYVDKNVLVPRPDTEILVDAAILYFGGLFSVSKEHLLLLDIGTGSGCIPISLLKNVQGIKAICTEISKPAFKVAKKNIKRHKLKKRIKLFKSDLLKNVPKRYFKNKEVIVTANLPYIPKQFKVDPSTKYEPDVALYGGEDGLDIYKRLAQQLGDIKPKAIFFELFEHQVAILCDHMPDYELKYTKGMTGEAKCLVMERKN